MAAKGFLRGTADLGREMECSLREMESCRREMKDSAARGSRGSWLVQTVAVDSLCERDSTKKATVAKLVDAKKRPLELRSCKNHLLDTETGDGKSGLGAAYAAPMFGGKEYRFFGGV